ncbi:MAG: TetR family transcriptional regulator [Acidobacteria bacterium]|nr:TetR family transcriptional regulator [Acidobacteriota bacterium]
MVRWEPGAKERLQLAAITLFVERGYEQTTVQDIAAAAGLTERTFFRHFADKREVLFVGSDVYAATFVQGVAEAPEGAAPFELATAAITAAARDFFPIERRAWSRQRQAVLDANTPLQERELLKRAALSDALTAAFRERGATEADARVAAETGVTAFHLAFRQWIAEGEERPLLEIEQDVLARMAAFMPGAASVAPD